MSASGYRCRNKRHCACRAARPEPGPLHGVGALLAYPGEAPSGGQPGATDYRHARRSPGIHVFIVGKQTKTWVAGDHPGHDGPASTGPAAVPRAFQDRMDFRAIRPAETRGPLKKQSACR